MSPPNNDTGDTYLDGRNADSGYGDMDSTDAGDIVDSESDDSDAEYTPTQDIPPLIPGISCSMSAITKTLAELEVMQRIGYCPSQETNLSATYSSPQELRSPDESHEVVVLKQAHLHFNRQIVEHCDNLVDEPFRLTITQTGCEYDDFIRSEFETESEDIILDVSYIDNIEALIQKLYAYAPTQEGPSDSAFPADVKVIPSDNFNVGQSLLCFIERAWDDQYAFECGVRAVPHEILIFGPEGDVNIRRADAEEDLIAICLVGLGDTNYEKSIEVKDLPFMSLRLAWCLFRHDIPWLVHPGDSYHSVILFKLFRRHGSRLTSLAKMHREQIRDALVDVALPFGLLMDAQYCRGVKPSLFDRSIAACARARRDAVVRFLPVVVAAYVETERAQSGTNRRGFFTAVYPFSAAHILDTVLEGGDGTLQEPQYAWIKHVTSVPFHSIDFDWSTVRWPTLASEHSLTISGRIPTTFVRESVHLSYAMLVLPNFAL